MEQPELLAYALDVLQRLRVPYMVVGSIASSAYGDPRLTQDIDIVIDATAAQIRQLCGAFPPADFYVSLDAALEAARNPGSQFNVLDPASGTKIDFMIARNDHWGKEQLARRQEVELVADKEGFAARPEDIIISKLLYYQEGGSEKHLRDIAGILKISGELVDRSYVERWVAEFDLNEIWQAILKRVGG